jgi:serine/threonine protein kinase
MTDASHSDHGTLPLSVARVLDRICDRFEQAWQAAAAGAARPRLEDYVAEVAEELRPALLRELIPLEIEYRRDQGEEPSAGEYQRRFPTLDPAWLLRQVTRGARSAEASMPNEPPATPPSNSGQGMAPSRPEPAPATEAWDQVNISGYEILDVLGRGGMGVVYKARQVGLKRLVALKMIRDGALASAEQVVRFRAEAEAVARLQHPNIVQIYDIGQHNNLPYFSLEFVSGGSLADKLRRGSLSTQHAAQLVATLAGAIHYAHERGVVHRDLKPANVLLTADGTAKITDFGLAKRLDDDLGLTQSEAILGTPAYMAPEQAWGRSKEVGPAADIHALGAILYELLTGRPPFRGTRQEIYDQIRFENPVRPTYERPEIPLDLEAICLKCLAKKPDQRYANAQVLADELQCFLLGDPLPSGPALVTSQGPGMSDADGRPEDWGSDDLRAEPTTVSEDLPAGRWPIIPGYEIQSECARTGMGVIYIARQVSLDRVVALKMINWGYSPATEQLARFRAEAAAVAHLRHPNIVHVYDFGEHDGQAYLSMEFIDGGDLKQKLAGTHLRARYAAEIMETLARAMHHAHQRGVVHRDLKPANVLLTADGIPKITDFGLVKRLDTESGSPSAWEAEGVIVGTVAYMAPEQAQAKNDQISPATDVYGLGATLYEMLTGRPPFQGAHALDILQQKIHRHELVPPRRLQPRVPRDLEAICLKCLQKESDKRYASAEELAEDLRRFLLGEPVHSRRIHLWERAVKWVRRRPLTAAGLGIIILAALAALRYLL